MKQLAKILLGFNLITFKHLIHMEFRRFLCACRSAFSSARNVGPYELTQIPEISLGDVLGERRPVIRLPVVQYEGGTLPSDQEMALLSILVAESPDEVLEVGTYMGHTTRQMAENLPKATIHTVDLPGSVSVKNGTQPHLPKDDLHLIDRRVVGRGAPLDLPPTVQFTRHTLGLRATPCHCIKRADSHESKGDDNGHEDARKVKVLEHPSPPSPRQDGPRSRLEPLLQPTGTNHLNKAAITSPNAATMSSNQANIVGASYGPRS